MADPARPIPLEDENVLRQLDRKGEEDELSPALVAAYWDFKAYWDLLSMGNTPPGVLALLALWTARQSGQPLPELPPPPPFNVIEAFHNQQLSSGAELEVKWRNKRTTATFVDVTPRDTCIVVLQDESQEREIPAKNVLGVAAPAASPETLPA